MLLLIYFIWDLLKSALGAAVVSALFCFFKWIGSLTNITDGPGWSSFFGGGIGMFVLFFGYKMFWIIRDMIRRKKDPEYDYAANTIGISYNTYKCFKKEQEDNK